MDKLRAAFGLSEDVKEGQAFDRELQEQLKQERIAAKEQQQRQKEKEDKKRRKAKKKEEKARKKEERRKAKEAKKQAIAKAKVSVTASLTEQGCPVHGHASSLVRNATGHSSCQNKDESSRFYLGCCSPDVSRTLENILPALRTLKGLAPGKTVNVGFLTGASFWSQFFASHAESAICRMWRSSAS